MTGRPRGGRNGCVEPALRFSLGHRIGIREVTRVMKTARPVAVAALVLAFGRMDADARVVRLVVERTTPYADGAAIGTHGPFERLGGTVYMVVDPEDPVNAVIVNLDKAPRNAEGLVEFSAPFVIIKPVDVRRGNRKILYGINNRGNNIEIAFHAYPSPGLRALFGSSIQTDDELIFRLGYTYVDAGWAGDITTTETRLGADLPLASEPDGGAVVSRIRIEYSASGYTLPLKGERPVPKLRDGRHRPGELDPDDSRRRQGPPGADRAGPMGVRPVPGWASVTRGDHHRHLSVRRIRPGPDLRAAVSREGRLGHGARLCRHPRPRVVSSVCGGGRRGQPEPPRRERDDPRRAPSVWVRYLVDRHVSAGLSLPRVQRG